MRVELQGGPRFAHFGEKDPDKPCPSLALHLGDRPGSSSSWLLDVDVVTEHGSSRVGSVLTAPQLPAASSGARLVAIAVVPGAIAWTVRGQRAGGLVADAADVANLQLSSSPHMGCCGLTLLAGSQNAADGTHQQTSGIGPAVVAIPAGARLRRYSATAVAADGTIQLGAFPLTTVRAGNSFTDDDLNPPGPFSVTFALGIDTWFVRWEG